MPEFFFDHHSNTGTKSTTKASISRTLMLPEDWRLRHWANRCWMARLAL